MCCGARICIDYVRNSVSSTRRAETGQDVCGIDRSTMDVAPLPITHAFLVGQPGHSGVVEAGARMTDPCTWARGAGSSDR
jgi:non-ribosomal peptide synthetase component E (peptide arylation enzyme)